MLFFFLYDTLRWSTAGWHWSGKSQGNLIFLQGQGKNQGILQIGQGSFRYQESQGKVREFHKLDPKLFGMQHIKCLKKLIFLLLASLARYY